MRRHSSFLLRCWDLGGDGQRIAIEHIQSGQRTLAHSVEMAVAWICERDAEAGAGHGAERAEDADDAPTCP